MSDTPTSREPASQSSTAGGVETKLEVVVLPVSDVDRAKRFYRLGVAAGRGLCHWARFSRRAGDTTRLAVLRRLRYGRHDGGARLRPGADAHRRRHRPGER